MRNCTQTYYDCVAANLITTVYVHNTSYFPVVKAHLGMDLSSGLGRSDVAPRTLLFICLTACFVFWPLEYASRLLKKLSTAIERQGRHPHLHPYCHRHWRLSRVLACTFAHFSFSSLGSVDRCNTIVRSCSFCIHK